MCKVYTGINIKLINCDHNIVLNQQLTYINDDLIAYLPPTY